jgi:hypothetical protein
MISWTSNLVWSLHFESEACQRLEVESTSQGFDPFLDWISAVLKLLRSKVDFFSTGFLVEKVEFAILFEFTLTTSCICSLIEFHLDLAFQLKASIQSWASAKDVNWFVVELCDHFDPKLKLLPVGVLNVFRGRVSLVFYSYLIAGRMIFLLFSALSWFKPRENIRSDSESRLFTHAWWFLKFWVILEQRSTHFLDIWVSKRDFLDVWFFVGSKI